MGRYNFGSVGNAGVNAIEEFLVQRQLEQRQKAEDEFRRQQAVEQSTRQGAQLKLQQEQEHRIAEAQKQAQADLAYNREDAQVGNVVDDSMKGDPVDEATAELIRKHGRGGAIQQGPDTQSSDALLGTVGDVKPGILEMRGGAKWINAEQQRQSAQSIAEASRLAAAQNAQNLEEGRNARAADANAIRLQIAQLTQAMQAGQEITLDQPTVDMFARQVAMGGGLPNFGMGKSAAGARQAVSNRASQFDTNTQQFRAPTPATPQVDPLTGTQAAAGPGGAPFTPPNLVLNKANLQATQGAMTQLTKNKAAVSAFEAAAIKNSKLLEEVAGQIPGQNLPTFLATPVRDLGRMFGNESMSRFDVLRRSVASEFARIINTQNLTGPLTDSARHEMDKILAPGATAGQVIESVRTLREEASNRHKSVDAELSALQSGLGGNGGGGGDTEVQWGRDATGRPVRK